MTSWCPSYSSLLVLVCFFSCGLGIGLWHGLGLGLERVNVFGAEAWRQGREEHLNDFLMAHSLPPDSSLSHRLKVNPVELVAARLAGCKKSVKRQMELDS